ncbi:hypothetical protein JL720_1167 [Aureococcus anophagefferens]|nr:hypothetical protein JL720_1167 [Aureococcus anophagefferens]
MLRLVAVAAAAAALAPLPTRPHVGARAVTKKAMSVSGGEVAKAPEAPWAVAGACAGAVLFGYHLGVVNTPLDAMSRTLGFAGDAKVAGAVVSSTLVGATAGSLLGGAAADRWGRRGAMVRNSFLLAAAAAGCAAAGTVPQLLAARLAAGVGIGIVSSITPLYISEVAPTARRGAYGALNQVAICVGILLSIATGLGVTPTSPGSRWRPMFAFALVPTLLHLALALKAPESPRWAGNADKQASAARLWGAAAAAELGRGGDVQQFAGINAVVYFSTKVFREAGLQSAVLGSVAVALTNILGTVCVATPLIDKFGRKAMLCSSYAGMAASMAVMAAAAATPALAGTPAIAATSFLGTIAYIFAFSCGCGPVPGLLTPELFPSKLRAKGGSIGMLSHWGCNTVVGAAFLPLVAQLGLPAVYAGFAAVAAASAIFAKVAIEETSGAALE